MNKRDSNYKYIGRQVVKLFPHIAELILTQKDAHQLLTDTGDINHLAGIFSRYYDINFPAMPDIAGRQATDYRIRFTTLCLLCYDPKTINGVASFRIRSALRQRIAEAMQIHPTLVSQYAAKARVYLKAYQDVENDIMQMIALVKIELTNGLTLTK